MLADIFAASSPSTTVWLEIHRPAVAKYVGNSAATLDRSVCVRVSGASPVYRPTPMPPTIRRLLSTPRLICHAVRKVRKRGGSLRQ